MKEDIKAAIERKKAIMAAEKSSIDKTEGGMSLSYVGGARTAFEERSKFKTAISGCKYASDSMINKFGRS